MKVTEGASPNLPFPDRQPTIKPTHHHTTTPPHHRTTLHATHSSASQRPALVFRSAAAPFIFYFLPPLLCVRARARARAHDFTLPGPLRGVSSHPMRKPFHVDGCAALPLRGGGDALGASLLPQSCTLNPCLVLIPGLRCRAPGYQQIREGPKFHVWLPPVCVPAFNFV